MSGNHSAASGDTKVKTAADTSPLINRLIALVCPLLSWTSPAPAAAIAVRRLASDADCRSSTAMFLWVRSDTDLISGRATRMATRWSLLSGDADAAFSATRGNTASAWWEWSVPFAFCPGPSAAVAAVARSWIVLELETAASLLKGRESAICACRISLELGAACFAVRARVADFDASPRIAVARCAFGERGAN